MREVLFRAKHIHTISKNEHLNGRWIEGYLADKNHINSPELEGEFLIDPETICQYSGMMDISGKRIFEEDIIERHLPNGEILAQDMVIKYGKYQAYCPVDKEYVDTIGFYAWIPGYPPMPLGTLEDYAKVIGNTFDNPYE